uniref:Uncharacterized mitochondrial protein AtMg00820-like n=1 Tax=Nicotiana tabacum TaxID=4097 RepID=A0A1S4CYX5_TOBAC|nr:PREDICTED: uncharacterized mitochondrial protein AtMg00820-like [Nicotiana tabacum]
MFIGELEDGSVTEIESRDVTFLENDFPKKGEVKNGEPLCEMLNSDSQQVSSDTVDNQIDQDLILYPSGSGSGNSQSQNPSDEPEFQLRKKIDEPKSVTEALSSPVKDEWMKAVKEELESMKTNKVWDLVDLPPGRRAIGNKRVLKVKHKVNGSIERYKARLVAKGFTQEAGIDYEETFLPVVKFTSIRLLLAIVARLDLELHQWT